MIRSMQVVGMLIEVEPSGDIAVASQLVLLVQLQFLGRLAGSQTIEIARLDAVVKSWIWDLIHRAWLGGRRRNMPRLTTRTGFSWSRTGAQFRSLAMRSACIRQTRVWRCVTRVLLARPRGIRCAGRGLSAVWRIFLSIAVVQASANLGKAIAPAVVSGRRVLLRCSAWHGVGGVAIGPSTGVVSAAGIRRRQSARLGQVVSVVLVRTTGSIVQAA